MVSEPGATLRMVAVDGEPYVRAGDVSVLLRDLAAHWRASARRVPDADGGEVARGLADLLTDQLTEVDFKLITGALAS
jgi:hypothetical protein